MTTIFDNLNEQLFTDISSEQAAMIQGGYNFEAWNFNIPPSDDNGTHSNPPIAAANNEIPILAPSADDKISHIHIKEGTWRVYRDAGFKGPHKDYKPGIHFLKGDRWDNANGLVSNNISSLEKRP
jgi:hypothetical protein